jgi:hypothetical protein
MRGLSVERSALGMLALAYLAYVSAVVLAAGVLVLGIGLVRHPAQ